MFISPAFAQAGPFGLSGDSSSMIVQFMPLILIIVIMYFLILRPQQRRMKQHQEMLGGLKRGDNIVLSSGMMGKIVRVEDTVVGVEIATGVTVRVRKAMITEVEARGTPAPANDKV